MKTLTVPSKSSSLSSHGTWATKKTTKKDENDRTEPPIYMLAMLIKPPE